MKIITCKSCGAPIVWIKTQNGRSMPCDATAVEYQENYKGSTTIVTDDGRVIRANIVAAGNSPLTPAIDGNGYISHFATCPYAKQHRQRNDR